MRDVLGVWAWSSISDYGGVVPCQQVTILREHCQGLNEMMWVLPTGGADARKHATKLEAAQAELSEEVRALYCSLTALRLQ